MLVCPFESLAFHQKQDSVLSKWAANSLVCVPRTVALSLVSRRPPSRGLPSVWEVSKETVSYSTVPTQCFSVVSSRESACHRLTRRGTAKSGLLKDL